MWNGDAATCFGDAELSGFADRERVFVDVGTGDHALLDEFAAQVRVLDPVRVPDHVLVELVDHMPLGTTPTEVSEALAALRRRRLLALMC